MKVKIFWYFEILNFRSDDVTFLRNVRNGHFGKRAKKQHNNDGRTDENNEDCDRKTTEKNRRPLRVATIVATIVAGQLLTTVRGGNQPSGLQRNQA